MDSASVRFVLFGLAVALLSNLSSSRIWRSSVLMVASIVFLSLLEQDPIVFLPFIGFLLLGYAALAFVRRGTSRSVVWSILAIIWTYIWLKRYTFLPDGIFLHSAYFTLGLSYIFFRVLHLLIETRDSPETEQIGLGAFLLYNLNFTTLISGPIQRYDEFARDQFASEPIPLGPRVIGLQLERIVRGFFKVNVVAMLLQAFQEDALAQLSQPLPQSLKLFAAFRLVLSFPFFVYCNFSGYIDIVIALARLMRVRLPENFDRPFSASSVLDFWSRWHMTLSNWVKTYVYNPLLMALMRRVPSREIEPFLAVFCFFVTFFLVGIWHGRTSEFVFFALLTGGGISINKLWQVALARILDYKALAKNSVYIAFCRGLNFTWFAFTNFWFWANWKQIHEIFTAVGAVEWLGVWLTIFFCATSALAFWEWLRSALLSIKSVEGSVLTNRYARVVYASALALAAAIMTILLNQPSPGIVYRTF
jgi:D-alanyl-lipoteichoic acid acyltransferase DltB (MBOAT superfamily)